MNIYSKGMLAFLVLTLLACTKDTKLFEETKSSNPFALTMSDVTYNPCWMDQDMAVRDIPDGIRAYISSNYPNLSIDDAERLGESLENFMAIEVELTNDAGLLFDLDGNFIAEENDSSRVVSRDSIPQTIHDYLNGRHPKASIDEVEYKSEYGVVFFEVELSNSAEFLFDEQGLPLCQIEAAETKFDDDKGDDDDNDDDDDDDDGDDD